MPRENLTLWILAVLGVGLLISALLGLRDSSAVVRYEFTADDAYHTPVLALQPRDWQRGPSAIVVHGYSGSKEMMQAIARSLAESGMAVYCPDLPGSGDSSERFRREEMRGVLRGFYQFLLAKGYIQSGKVALIGHSMGGGLVTELACETDGVRATVAISSAPAELGPQRPLNFLAVIGGRDLPGLRDTTIRLMRDATSGAISQNGQETGDIAQGTARRFIVVDGANHLGIVYNLRAIREMQEWLGRSFGLRSLPQPSRRMSWVGVSYVGIFFLFIPLAALMGAVKQPREVLSFDHRAGWRNNLMWLPAGLLSLLILRYWLPLGFVRIEAGSYLASFFLLAGLIRFLLTRLTQTPDPSLDLDDLMSSILIGLVTFLFLYLTFGAITHRNWLYMLEGAARLKWFVVIALGISPFFMEDEKVGRSVQEDSSAMTSYFYSMGGKVCILAVLLLPIVSPFFRAPRFLLTMGYPFMVVFFTVFQLLSVVLYHFTRRTMATAVFNILLFAWLLTAPFVQA